MAEEVCDIFGFKVDIYEFSLAQGVSFRVSLRVSPAQAFSNWALKFKLTSLQNNGFSKDSIIVGQI